MNVICMGFRSITASASFAPEVLELPLPWLAQFPNLRDVLDRLARHLELFLRIGRVPVNLRLRRMKLFEGSQK